MATRNWPTNLVRSAKTGRPAWPGRPDLGRPAGRLKGPSLFKGRGLGAPPSLLQRTLHPCLLLAFPACFLAASYLPLLLASWLPPLCLLLLLQICPNFCSSFCSRSAPTSAPNQPPFPLFLCFRSAANLASVCCPRSGSATTCGASAEAHYRLAALED